MSVNPEALAVTAVREYLLQVLPAKVASLNSTRRAVLKSALAGGYMVPQGAVLRLAATPDATPTDVPLTSGGALTRTATQLAADINGWFPVGQAPVTASADGAGRLVLTSVSLPAEGAPSMVVVAADVGPTGSNAMLGWAEGGEHVETAALVAPSWRGVVDGRPLAAPDMGQGFWVMLGTRTARPTHPGIRRDTFTVTIATEVWRPFSANGAPHRNREAISACVQALREVLTTTTGRYLGRQAFGDVNLTDVPDATIAGDPLSLQESPGILFDVARLTLTVRVFQRPD